jgi:hypothetical protein
VLDLVDAAWHGPAYRMTAQIEGWSGEQLASALDRQREERRA